MRMPYQCMTRCGDILVAARGSSIDLFKLQDGSLLSTWNCSNHDNQNGKVSDGGGADLTTMLVTTQTSESSSVEIALDAASPPAKKRKLSHSEQSPNQTEPKNGKKKQNNRSAAVASGLEAPAVTVLASTTDRKHVVAVTGEDKSIRVFEIVTTDGVHILKQLSQRNMPKRPCTVAITKDNSTIISADKFGDVYALPLLPSKDLAKPSPVFEPASSKPFVPAANELTIHSQRNRKALENQKRHSNKASEKSEPTFEHKLLLGHVSMLTDVALVTSDEKDYIITADRDEHIRISRGIPQSHIIEGFCLGHTDFITRLCIPRNRSNLLISAGGDDELFVWKWQSSQLVSRANLKRHAEALKTKSTGSDTVQESTEPFKIAVSGLYHTQRYVDDHFVDFIIVTCEGIAALFLFDLHADDNSLRYIQTFELPGNPLAVVANMSPTQCSSNEVIVSVDMVHQPGSTVERRLGSATEQSLLAIQLCDSGLVSGGVTFREPVEEDKSLSSSDDTTGRLGNLLYNLENLRKRDGEGQDE
ncbi:uncharacterized protein LY89DRAFT_714084 [Mollisia scopiformis]|uniref:Uncharacterized protein n=1 Tax=Mollisia scopiformis TaxID=149040 RepID=A0A194XR93_MOLSC|nr:uncharacterized protein LY89DRAFT_714084 [Mollisia scopiformis]KUJ22247.1 hypothetical protein LY89DRAFT_714084 [Mollisia scopiformis]